MSPDGSAQAQVLGTWMQGDRPAYTLGRGTYVNGKWIEILYGRPLKRGRDLYGSGADYGKAVNDVGTDTLPAPPVWRAGANVSTRLHSDVVLTFPGGTVPPGDYTMFVDLKGPTEWTLIVSRWPAQMKFNPQDKTAVWGAYFYTPDKDVARIPMKVDTLPFEVEELTWSFVDMTNDSGKIALMWGKTMASAAFKASMASAQAAPVAPVPAPAPTRITADGQGVGPQVHETVPDFSLPDAHGTMHTLPSLLGPKGATIVFIRSADWCPPCKAHLIELQGHLQELHRLGMNVFVISRDSQAINAEFAAQHGITFPILSDTDSAVIKRFGVLDASVAATRTEASGGPPYYGVPYRGTITIDRNRVVTSTNFQKTWQEHTTMSSVLLRLGDRIDVPGTDIAAPHLQMKSYATDPAVAPGAHFLLVLDLRPDQKIHVYAPGNASYIPVALKIQKQPGVIVGATTPMPKAEDFFFKPLNEHVAVYRRPFRITQEVMIDPSRQGQAALNGATQVAIKGTLTYQACDDTTCYNPRDVPLSWAVNLRPLDNTRIVIPRTN